MQGMDRVPEDLTLVVARAFKVTKNSDNLGRHILRCLNETDDALTQRLIIIENLPDHLWTGEDILLKEELKRAGDKLEGKWAPVVLREAVDAKVINEMVESRGRKLTVAVVN